MIIINQRRDYSKSTAEEYLKHLSELVRYHKFIKYGEAGVAALKEATPTDTGYTASSWYYKITIKEGESVKIQFLNSHIEKGWANIALLLQLGHGTGTGGYVEGRDYINPALQPIFEKMANELWKEVTTTTYVNSN